MAGVRQHYLPQFLQTGFASHFAEDAAFVWVFRRRGKPYNCCTRNTGLERHFYSAGADNTVDDAITEAEKRYSALVRRLRAVPAGPARDVEIPEFLAHLEVRSRHLRQSFLEGTNYLVDRLLDFISDGEAFTAMVRRRIESDPAWFRQIFVDELRKRGISDGQLEAITSAMMPLVHNLMPVFLEQIKPQLPAMIASMRAAFPAALEKAAKDGHLRALGQAVAPEYRVGILSDLKYTVVDIPSNDLVLGDSAVVYQIDGPRSFRPYTQKDDKVFASFLPLTPNRLLIGENGAATWDARQLKRQVARCSYEFFIGHENSAQNAGMLTEVGIDAEILTKQEIEKIVSDLCLGDHGHGQRSP